MSQSYLAEKAYVSRETVCKSMPDIDGEVIVKIYNHFETCDYWLTSWFLNNRHHFYDLIPSLRQISLLMLFSITNNVYSQNVTLYKDINYSNRTSSTAGVVVPQFGTGWVMLTVKNAPLEYDDPGYASWNPSTTIIYKQNNKQTNTTTTSIDVLPLKESVMNQKPAIQLIADSYGLSVQQEELLSNYSDAALEYALKQLVRTNKHKAINAPVNWIAAVAASFEKKAQRFPNKGKEVGHSAQPRNPSGHSPAGEPSNLSYDERIEFASNQESVWEEIFQSGESIAGFHDGYAERAKSNWQRIAKNPQEFPSSINSFQNTKQQSANYGKDDPDYEEHLDEISRDKSDPEGYKLMVRAYDYRRMAR
jgi:hypothetical protein